MLLDTNNTATGISRPGSPIGTFSALYCFKTLYTLYTFLPINYKHNFFLLNSILDFKLVHNGHGGILLVPCVPIGAPGLSGP